MADLIRKPLVWAIGALLIALAAWWLVATLTGGKSAKVEARVEAGRGDAAVQSGADAVNTVGGRSSAEAAIENEVNDAQDAINAAPDAGAADRAARDSVCRVSPASCRQGAVQRPGAP